MVPLFFSHKLCMHAAAVREASDYKQWVKSVEEWFKFQSAIQGIHELGRCVA
jgi:hypothetical protein